MYNITLILAKLTQNGFEVSLTFICKKSQKSPTQTNGFQSRQGSHLYQKRLTDNELIKELESYVCLNPQSQNLSYLKVT